jgi:hypothetical protein
MDSLETRLQNRIYVSLYALLFLAALLGLSVILEGCAGKSEVMTTGKSMSYLQQSEIEIIQMSKGFFV